MVLLYQLVHAKCQQKAMDLHSVIFMCNIYVIHGFIILTVYSNRACMSNFLNDFTNSLNKLNAIINQSKTYSKDSAFSAELQVKLKSINDQVAALVNKFRGLKNEVDKLSGKMNTNSANINTKDQEIEQLKRKLTEIQSQYEAQIQQLVQVGQQLHADVDNKQRAIDDCEAQLRQLKDQSQNASAQIQQRLNDQLKQLETTAASQNAQLTGEQQKQDALLAQIQQLEQQLNACQEQLKQSNANLNTLQTKQTVATSDAQTQIQSLTNEKQQLIASNNTLAEHIKKAIDAMNNAYAVISQLISGVDDSTTNTNIRALLQNIQDTLNSVSGNTTSLPPPPPPAQPPLAQPPPPTQPPLAQLPPPSQPYNNPFNNSAAQATVQLGQYKQQIIAKLRKYIADNPTHTELNRLVDEINSDTITSKEQVNALLANWKINIAQLKGGKRRRVTKKHRKKRHRRTRGQHGGFIYNRTTRRKAIR